MFTANFNNIYYREIKKGHFKEAPLFIKEVRQRSTLPHGHPCSTIDAERLNFRVRNGTGCFPLAMVAETLLSFRSKQDLAIKENAVKVFSLNCGSRDRISRATQWTRSNFVVKSSAY